jgi:hypothetical protein
MASGDGILGLRIDDPHHGRWCLVLIEADPATYELFDSMELQGGGYTWLAITEALLSWKQPDWAPALDLNAEGGEMYVYCATREPLEALREMLENAASDHSVMKEAMSFAGEDLE